MRAGGFLDRHPSRIKFGAGFRLKTPYGWRLSGIWKQFHFALRQGGGLLQSSFFPIAPALLICAVVMSALRPTEVDWLSGGRQTKVDWGKNEGTITKFPNMRIAEYILVFNHSQNADVWRDIDFSEIESAVRRFGSGSDKYLARYWLARDEFFKRRVVHITQPYLISDSDAGISSGSAANVFNSGRDRPISRPSSSFAVIRNWGIIGEEFNAVRKDNSAVGDNLSVTRNPSLPNARASNYDGESRVEENA